MPHFATAPEEPFISFERGIDREDPRTDIAKGGYDSAINVLLRNQFQGGTHIASMYADLPYDTVTKVVTTLDFVAPFTYSTYSAGVLAFATHLILVEATGDMWRYDPGSPATLTIVRRGFTASQHYWTHAIFDQWLVFCNGREAPQKYGQHFLVDSQAEPRPLPFPVGAKPVTPAGAALTGETWTHGAGGGFTNDASVPGGGSRVHTQSLLVKANTNTFLNWVTPSATPANTRDFLSGPYPYGGTDFTDSDFLILQVFKTTGTANLRIRFGNNAGTIHYTWTQSVPANAAWQTLRLARSAAVVTGTPVVDVSDWGSIERLTFFNDDAANDIYVDDVSFLYGNAPPAFQVASYHKGRLMGGGAPTAGTLATPALANLYWSRVAFPDEFPAANVLPISGGVNALSKANQITALVEFGPSILIGTPHSITSFTLDTQGNPVQQSVTNEHGMDSHRACVQTPNGALIFPWQKGMYVIRATWRALGSTKIAPLFDFVWQIQPQWTVGVYDEKTQTLRWWFRLQTDPAVNPTNTSLGIIFDYVRAQELGEAVFPSTMTQLADQAVPVYVNGQREVLYITYGSNVIKRMGVDNALTTTLASEVQFPWMAREGRDKLTKWIGLVVPYAARAPVTVSIRYADHPQDFDAAVYKVTQILPASPGMVDEQARVLFGETSRWAQVRLSCEKPGGMEIYPPVSFLAYPTMRQP